MDDNDGLQLTRFDRALGWLAVVLMVLVAASAGIVAVLMGPR